MQKIETKQWCSHRRGFTIHHQPDQGIASRCYK